MRKLKRREVKYLGHSHTASLCRVGLKSEIKEQDDSWREEFGHQNAVRKAIFSDLGNNLN